MQQPPPVTLLLEQMGTFAGRLAQRLAEPEIDWECVPDPEEWCLTEVMCHLRDVEHEVHQPRFHALLAAENAFLPGAVADDWLQSRAYFRQQGPVALGEFVTARRQTLTLLSSLEPEVWERQGQHAFFGPTTMHELLNLVVQHDQAHWEQVMKLLGDEAAPNHAEAY